MLFFSPLFLKARERFYFLFYFRTFASDYKADNMRRPQIIERIRKALGQVAPRLFFMEVKHVGMPVRIVI